MKTIHDESKCLRSLSKVLNVNFVDKFLLANKNAVIGIHSWGKIDFLVKCCGWHFIWDNSAKLTRSEALALAKDRGLDTKEARKEFKTKNKRNLKNE